MVYQNDYIWGGIFIDNFVMVEDSIFIIQNKNFLI